MLKVILASALVGGLVGSATAWSAYGLMPLEITVDPEVKVLGGTERLGYLHAVVQRTQGPGPQALEGYTLVSHAGGTVDLAIGTIGNVELSATGHTAIARSLQGGGVITGPGQIDHWSSLHLTRPMAGYDGPVNVQRVDYISFDNGWSIRPNGDQLLICDPSGACRAF